MLSPSRHIPRLLRHVGTTAAASFRRAASSSSSLSTLLPPNAQHTSLPTYLAHARRHALSPTSPTFLGTRYEYIVSDALRRLGIDTVRVGQAGDRGVDLVGYWHLPASFSSSSFSSSSFSSSSFSQQEQDTPTPTHQTPPIRVIVQCKRLAKKVTPSVVRELEGSFAAGGWGRGRVQKDAVMGVVVGTMAATKGVVEGLKRAGGALVWVCVEEVDAVGPQHEHQQQGEGDEEEEETKQQQDEYGVKAGKIRQVLWNQRASALGLEGVDVVKRHYATPHEQQTGDEVELHWRGHKVDGLPPC